MWDHADDLNRIACRCRRENKNACRLAIESVTVGERTAISIGGIVAEQGTLADTPTMGIVHNKKEKHNFLRTTMTKVRAIWILGKQNRQPVDESSGEL
ncbi:unnamed protein product [Polarella glacialis]|uniref:Uncharacterized protein n=1 Tax=Polarella glacialis TaxID=89957 RepID=A0A813LTJ1_POLGL|nr:unnamed protein product [Polarella glacialis]